MDSNEHWQHFIAAYDIEKFKRITYKALIEFLQREDVEDTAPWMAPPDGRKYADLIIKFYGVSILLKDPQVPYFRVRYNLYLEKDDLMPYYYYDMDFDLDEVIVDNFFSTHIIQKWD